MPAQAHASIKPSSPVNWMLGLIAVLLELTSGRTPQEIVALDIGNAFERLGLEINISMNRRNGFYSMVERIKQMAAAETA